MPIINFGDSNFVIAYIFYFDRLFEKIMKLISNIKSTLYYSPHIYSEVKKVFRKKIKSYNSFLMKSLNFLERHYDNDVISQHSIYNHFLSKNYTKTKIDEISRYLSIIWKVFQLDESEECYKLKNIINTILLNYEKQYRYKRDDFFKNMKSIPNHKHKDQKVLDEIKIKSLKPDYLHDEDEEILFDAHEYCQINNNVDFTIITSDNNFIYSITELKNVLSFNNYINVNEI